MLIKDTLHMGKTNFPMRGNLPIKEPEAQKKWLEDNLYERRQKLNEGKPTFILHDGPPFANGDIHMGHAMNKISKDIIIRFKSMSGYRSPFVPGWDTHGLPIEQQLSKKGINRKKIDILTYRKMCYEYAINEINKQRTEFKRLGISADWCHPYITFQPQYESEEIRVFGKMVDRGLIYRGKKPVYWSWSSESTLADAEVEYHDITSPSMYVKFKVVNGKGIIDNDTYFIIWTTTPWTIPANEGIAVNPKFEYVQILADGEKYIVAKKLLNKLIGEFNWKSVNILKTFKGIDLEKISTKHPIYNRTSLVILANYVTLDAGTGIVHIAPGHGEDDYNAGIKYELPVLSIVDSKGYITKDAPGFEGIFYDDANKVVSEKLKDNGNLLKLSFFKHSYPHDWRTKKPVIFRATYQWFASIENIRQEILNEINEISFLPEWGKKRLFNMIKDRGDWVISRQRAWGVPLPIFYAENGDAILNSKTINHIADLFSKYGSDIWFERKAVDLLPKGFTYSGSPNGKFTKENDILDVWFDSGSSYQAVLKQRPDLSFPANLYLEGSDQFRGWFNASLITSTAVNDVSPYESILSQGFTLDDKGRKMSKSLGNTIAPQKIIKMFGSEIIRLWVSSIDTNADVHVSMNSFKQVSETYRKIRNTMRFMLANTSDFNYKKNKVDYNNLSSVDKYIEIKLNNVITKCFIAYNNYDFVSVHKQIVSFLVNDLSSFYLDFSKDIIYIYSENDHRRRSMQTVMYDVLVSITKILTPILPYTCEEIWNYLNESEEYVQLSEMPEVVHHDDDAALIAIWNDFMILRDKILKSLEIARDNKVIGKSMEASVTLYVNEPIKALLNELNENIMQILIVSDLKIDDIKNAPLNAIKFDDVSIVIKHAEGKVCERCRMIRKDVGINSQFPNLCQRCVDVLHYDYPNVKNFE